jgi:hypothetical protein
MEPAVSEEKTPRSRGFLFMLIQAKNIEHCAEDWKQPRKSSHQFHKKEFHIRPCICKYIPNFSIAIRQYHIVVIMDSFEKEFDQ